MLQWIRQLGLPGGAVCLNVGSSTKMFRTVERPHIDRLLFRPLAVEGLRVIHCDMKAAEGVDEVGNVMDPAFQQRMRAYDAQLLICSNLLEHLADPASFVGQCAGLVKPGGYAFLTVPRSYPYHPDPIDTMFRPTPEQLAELLPEWRTVRSGVFSCGSYMGDLRAGRNSVRKLGRKLARAMVPFYRPRGWWRNADRLSYLFRPYRVTLLMLQRLPLETATAGIPALRSDEEATRTSSAGFEERSFV